MPRHILLLALTLSTFFWMCTSEDDDCQIDDIVLIYGQCTGDSYPLTIDFEYQNPSNDYFDVFDRDGLIGSYPLADLPITIDSFASSDFDDDFIKICIDQATDCCKEWEWTPPFCDEQTEDCEVFDIVTELGECNGDGTYVLNIDFEYTNPGNEFFDLFVRNDEFIGYFRLDELPITIESFPLSGNDYDFIRVCINDNPDCCQAWEFMPPDC